MKTGPYDVHSPMIIGGEISEAEAFGAAVWLWMHSPQHRDLPIHALPTVLLPIINRQQYVLVSRGTTPRVFMSWMWLDDVAERRYLSQPAIMVQERDWAAAKECGSATGLPLLVTPCPCAICSAGYFFLNAAHARFITAEPKKARG